MITATHLHAMAVHFPIALLMAGFLSEILSLITKKKFFADAAFYLLMLGTIGATIAYFAGRSAGEGMEEGELAKAMELHEQAANIAFILTLVTAGFYLLQYFKKLSQGWVKYVATLLFAITVGAIARTAYLGGELVYKHGAGVEIGLPDFSKPE